MKKLIYLSFIVGGVVVFSSAGEHKSAGPPGCFAGEPPNNTNCTSCHTDYAVNSGTATVLFDVGGADTGYVPGATYDIKVSIKNTAMAAGGFQFIALQDNDVKKSPGTITLNDAVRTQKVDPSNPHVQGCGLFDKIYVEHTYTGHQLNGANENSWSFKWKAPDNYVGDISFYLATVESNYSGDEFGDYVYTRKAVSKGKPNSIDGVNGIMADVTVFPNPVASKLYINTGEHTVDKVVLMNTQGIAIRQFDGASIKNNNVLTLDVHGLSTGVYFAVIKSEGRQATRKVVIQ